MRRLKIVSFFSVAFFIITVKAFHVGGNSNEDKKLSNDFVDALEMLGKTISGDDTIPTQNTKMALKKLKAVISNSKSVEEVLTAKWLLAFTWSTIPRSPDDDSKIEKGLLEIIEGYPDTWQATTSLCLLGEVLNTRGNIHFWSIDKSEEEKAKELYKEAIRYSLKGSKRVEELKEEELDVFKLYKHSPKVMKEGLVATCYFALAGSYYGIDDIKSAEKALNYIIKNYPKTTAAEHAEKSLNEIKNGQTIKWHKKKYIDETIKTRQWEKERKEKCIQDIVKKYPTFTDLKLKKELEDFYEFTDCEDAHIWAEKHPEKNKINE